MWSPRCWSNYLGRQPQLPTSSISVPKFDVFPTEDADIWRPYTDSVIDQAHAQPSRTRAVALQISQLCEISSDLLSYFYHPHLLERPLGKQAGLKKLSELHTRLEAWRKALPKEFEPSEGQLPNVLVMQYVQRISNIRSFLTLLQYVLPPSPYPSLPTFPQIQANIVTSALSRFAPEVPHTSCPCNIKTLKTISPNVRSPSYMQYRRLHCPLGMHNTFAQSAGQTCHSGHCAWLESPRRDFRKLALRTEDAGHSSSSEQKMGYRPSRTSTEDVRARRRQVWSLQSARPWAVAEVRASGASGI